MGNANSIAPEIIADIPPLTPVFVLQDPEGMELKWANVRAVARANVGRRRRKPEQLINFSDGVLRLFWTNQPLTPEMEETLTGYFGNAAWSDIVDDRGAGLLEAGQTIRAAVELYKRQLREDAGYSHVIDCEIRRDQVTRGQRAYHLVFASDHPDAPGIMEDAFKKVHVGQSRFPGMLPASSDE